MHHGCINYKDNFILLFFSLTIMKENAGVIITVTRDIYPGG